MLATIVALTLVSAVVVTALPWPLKFLIDYALSDDVSTSMVERMTPATLVIIAAVAALVLHLANAALNIALTWCWDSAGQRMVRALAGDLFGRLQRLSLIFHSRNTVGDSLNRIMGDTYCLYRLLDILLVTPIHRVLTLAAVGIVAWQLNWVLTCVLFLVAPMFAIVSIYLGPKILYHAGDLRRSRSHLTAFVHQILLALPVVKAFCAEERNVQRYEQLAENTIRTNRRGVMLQQTFATLNGIASTIAIAVVLFLGGRDVLAGSMTVGSLLVFLQYSKSIQDSFHILIQRYSELRVTEASLDRVLEILDSDHNVSESPDAVSLAADGVRPRGDIRFRNVTFGYDTGNPILKDVNLHIQAGETIAFVGATGAGKTTLVSMVPRFFDPWEGAVEIDGLNVKQVRLSDLRTHIAMVLQQPFLMPTSIAQNIAYGKPDATMDEIIAAARFANAEEFIRQLPNGFDTVIGERGCTLSGGEKQRVAIARAVLNDSAMIILDEPTSALDGRTEIVVMDALERMRQGRTTLIIAHRLSTARQADRVMVIDDGRIVECGTHDELIALGGKYANLFRIQFLESHREVT